MKKLNLLLLLVTTFVLFSCDSQTISDAKENASSNAVKTTESVEAKTGLIAGHLMENDNETVYLLGPDGVKLEVNKSDIVRKTDWEEAFDNLDGEPTIIEVKEGTIIKDGNQTHTVKWRELKEEPNACKCEISCGYNKYCCAMNGFKPKCISGGCGTTSERCD